jgi:hypothetical protein
MIKQWNKQKIDFPKDVQKDTELKDDCIKNDIAISSISKETNIEKNKKIMDMMLTIPNFEIKKKVKEKQENNSSNIIEYTEDFDIIEFHQDYMRRLKEKNKQQIQMLEQEYQEQIHKIQTDGSQTVIDRKNMLNEIQKNVNERKKIKSDTEEFDQQAKSILEEFSKMNHTDEKISFAKKKQICVNTDFKNKKLNIIENYLSLLKKYFLIDSLCIGKKNILSDKLQCSNCNVFLDNIEDSNCCQECGLEILNIFKSSADDSSTNVYEDSSNFYKELLRYQGKQPNRLPKDWKQQITKYFLSFGFKDIVPHENLCCIQQDKMDISILETEKNTIEKSQTKSKNIDNTEKYAIPSVELRERMFKALNQIGCSDYYSDINLICHLYWKWPLPDLSYLESEIMDDYTATQAIYDMIPKDRDSNINIQYRLFKHLQARGYPCKLEDFKIVKTPEILEYYEAVWKIMAHGADLPYYPTLQ